jgi:hypothetical protein
MYNLMRKSCGPAALALTGAVVSASLLLTPSNAQACGCFAPPDPSVPIVQAGENIVFSHEDGVITAHIQIQFQGSANEFGWLLPLPSEPDMKLGIEELFTQVINTTQPKYRLNQVVGDSCEWNNTFGRGGGFPANADSQGNPPAPEDPGLKVITGSVGPFDFAKIQADDKQKMFDWLTANHFFVPAGTESVVDQYINNNAWFLALKLRKGEDTGDLQPVVVRYASDLPMIPIILTQVTATPDMGVQVWVLGDSRAIPRNFHHTVLNTEHIDWFNAGANYAEVVGKAVDEANGHHSFVTEYAGTTDVMKDLLDPQGRFGTRGNFEVETDAGRYVQALRQNGFIWTSPLINTLKEYFPEPQFLKDEGVAEDQFYNSIDYYLGYDRQSRPESWRNVDLSFDAVALTGKLWERIVTPTLDAGALFKKFGKMTRLYTVLSPEEMNSDPVFSFNKDLADVSNVHEASLTYICSFFQDGPNNTPAILKLDDGREFYVKTQADWAARDVSRVPFSTRIETLREEGPPVIEVDNTSKISGGENDNGCACTTSEPAPSSSDGAPIGLSIAGLIGFALLMLPRKR